MNTDSDRPVPETANPASPVPLVAPPPRTRRWPWIMLAVSAFCFGIACGAGITLVGVIHRVRQSLRHPELRTERAAQFISRRLRLTPAQRQQVRAILQEQAVELGRIRAETMPRVTDRLKTTRVEVDKVLTPDQQKVWERLADELRRKLQPAVVGGEVSVP